MIDIGVMIYCIMNGISYSSSFNIFAVVLGILLLRGSLRAASIVRFFGAFFLAGFLGLIAAWPVLQPLGLTLAELHRMAVSDIAFYSAFALCGLTLLFWITLELNEDAVVTALQSAGRKVRPLYVPVAFGHRNCCRRQWRNGFHDRRRDRQTCDGSGRGKARPGVPLSRELAAHERNRSGHFGVRRRHRVERRRGPRHSRRVAAIARRIERGRAPGRHG